MISLAASAVAVIVKAKGASVVDEVEKKVDLQHMEDVLMAEGIQKFADPQKALLDLIGEQVLRRPEVTWERLCELSPSAGERAQGISAETI